MEQALYRPEEVARILSIGRSAVYEAMRRGDLESVLIGRSRRIPAVAIEAFVAHLRSA